MITIHAVRIFRLFADHPAKWFTNADVATKAKVAARTARLYTLRLAKAGVLDQAEMYPGYRFRLAKNPKPAYVAQIKKAAEVFGV